MVSKKHKLLIDYLTRKSPEIVTSKELARNFDVTTRTIRNWIAAINNNDKSLIKSSNSGYFIQLPSNMIEESVSSTMGNDSASARRAKIFLELLKESGRKISIYDLANKFFISDSTLRNDIRKLKDEITTNSLELYISKDTIYLEGSEKDKRRHMVSLLYSEATINKEVKKQIEKSFDYLSIENIENDIREVVLEETNILLNQYVVRNIAIHIIVTIERITQNNLLDLEIQQDKLKDMDKEIRITKKIVDRISEYYYIEFPYEEIVQLSLLFSGFGLRHELSPRYSTDSIKVDREIIEKLEEIIRKTEELYLIDLQDKFFFKSLLIHVQNLLIRSQYRSYERNNRLIDIKIAYPITYDISVYIAQLIQEAFNIELPEGEISFIALHIGALLEKKELVLEFPIKLLIIADDYQNIRAQMKKKIRNSLSSNHIIHSDIYLKKEYLDDFDVVITTDEQLAINYPGIVLVNPFILPKDLKKIENRIEQIRVSRHKNNITQYIGKYFSEDLYYNQLDLSEISIEEIIKLLSTKLVKKKYIEESYIDKLLEREKMAPTSFPSGIAVPHTVELDANSTKIVVATLQAPIIWNDNEIRLIVLTAINKQDAKSFNDFFQRMLEVTAEPINVISLSKADSYEEFINRLTLLLYENI